MAPFVFLVLWTFCWCWRERSRRKSIKELEQQRHDDRVKLLQEYGKLLSEARLDAEDLPLIACLERVEPPDEIEPPAAS